MIFFKPEKTDCDNTARIVALDGENETGSCTVSVNGYECLLNGVTVSDADRLTAEGLIRSALNFAANRGANIAVCGDSEYNDVLELLGFRKNGDSFSGEIPELLKGSCCKQ